MQVQPYLFFDGRCEEAMAFYAQAIGAETTFLMRFKEAPPGQGEGCANMDPEKIMHANLQIGDSQLMLSDGSPPGTAFTGFSLSVSAATAQEAEQRFNALAAGGQVTMPLQKTFWAQAFGMLVDRFGVSWMVNCE
ncbi:VOC family protein [Pseudomonas cavernae]|uniref:VOC family protein n=1 Tax=Pseudomonas cavernae TaxID=2320867 RepID=A0A385Z1M5_9PSED|nr:VOC family protein [Pseudomonas cavernae]AYC31738.1 VOC family protein [Pseudomonas cavernae]